MRFMVYIVSCPFEHIEVLLLEIVDRLERGILTEQLYKLPGDDATRSMAIALQTLRINSAPKLVFWIYITRVGSVSNDHP